MPRHTIVSSFSPEGFEAYGRDFIETFISHWPDTIRLVIFHEWETMPYRLDVLYGSRVEWRSIHEVPHHDEWMRWIKGIPLMRGDMGGSYNIQFDTRMVRKVFIQTHAVDVFGGKVFWLDADTFTHADVPYEFLDDVLPDDKLCCYLGREKVYTESGFLGFNREHPECVRFFHLYQQMVLLRFILTQPAWHDCIAFDMARTGGGFDPAIFVNLGEGVDPGPGLQVFNNSILGNFADHRKGARKGAPSPVEELTTRRTEPYWQRGDAPAPVVTAEREGMFERNGPGDAPCDTEPPPGVDPYLQTR